MLKYKDVFIFMKNYIVHKQQGIMNQLFFCSDKVHKVH